MLRMLDLFAGIGGFSYAGEKLVGGFETVAFCEYDEHAQKVLRKHWPDTEIIGDIRELADDADRFRGMVDIITGGYPCQPFSLAGVRRGDQDDRHLWPEMLRVIEAVRPRWVIGENVAGHISMGLDEVLSDLEAAGYTSRCYVIPAVAADARHRRDRCWVVGADTRHKGVHERWQSANVDENCQQPGRVERDGVPRWQIAKGKDLADASGEGLQGDVGQGQARAQGQSQGYPAQCRWWEPEPAVGRVVNGVPSRVHRLKQLGNSIVPQVAARILYAIKEADNASEIRD